MCFQHCLRGIGLRYTPQTLFITLLLGSKPLYVCYRTIYRYGLGRYAYRYAWCRIAILSEIQLPIKLANFLPNINSSIFNYLVFLLQRLTRQKDK